MHFSASRSAKACSRHFSCTILMHHSMAGRVVGKKGRIVLGLHARHGDNSRYNNANITSKKQGASPLLSNSKDDDLPARQYVGLQMRTTFEAKRNNTSKLYPVRTRLSTWQFSMHLSESHTLTCANALRE